MMSSRKKILMLIKILMITLAKENTNDTGLMR